MTREAEVQEVIERAYEAGFYGMTYLIDEKRNYLRITGYTPVTNVRGVWASISSLKRMVEIAEEIS